MMMVVRLTEMLLSWQQRRLMRSVPRMARVTIHQRVMTVTRMRMFGRKRGGHLAGRGRSSASVMKRRRRSADVGHAARRLQQMRCCRRRRRRSCTCDTRNERRRQSVHGLSHVIMPFQIQEGTGGRGRASTRAICARTGLRAAETVGRHFTRHGASRTFLSKSSQEMT